MELSWLKRMQTLLVEPALALQLCLKPNSGKDEAHSEAPRDFPFLVVPEEYHDRFLQFHKMN